MAMIWFLLIGVSVSAAELRRRVVYTDVELEFSAREVRRYMRLATGHHADEISLIADCNELAATSSRFNETVLLTTGACAQIHLSAPLLASHHTIISNDQVILIAGVTAQDVLFGAYTFAEQLGIHFSLHGDILPDPNMPLPLAKYAHQSLSGHVKSVLSSPQFDYRGLQVSSKLFHSHCAFVRSFVRSFVHPCRCLGGWSACTYTHMEKYMHAYIYINTYTYIHIYN